MYINDFFFWKLILQGSTPPPPTPLKIPRNKFDKWATGTWIYVPKKTEANWEYLIQKRKLEPQFVFISHLVIPHCAFPLTLPSLFPGSKRTITIVLTTYFQFRLPLTPWFTDFVFGQPVVELLCNNLQTLINRYKIVICTYGGVEVTAVWHQTQQKDRHLALRW